MYEKLTPGSIALLIVVCVVALVSIIVPIFVAAGHGKKRQAEGPETWIAIGTPPAHFDLALSLIRIHAVHLLGDAALALRWGGFIEWSNAEPSGILDYGVPTIRVRWAERIEDTALAVLLLEWAQVRLDVRPSPDAVNASVLSLAVDTARLAGRSTR
jgi:hypothetical protein